MRWARIRLGKNFQRVGLLDRDPLGRRLPVEWVRLDHLQPQVPREEFIDGRALGVAIAVALVGQMKVLHLFLRTEEPVYVPDVGELHARDRVRPIAADGNKQLRTRSGKGRDLCVVSIRIVMDRQS